MTWLLISGTPLPDVQWLRYDRTDAQVGLLERVLLHGARLRDLDDDVPPRLMLGTTDTLTGTACRGGRRPAVPPRAVPRRASFPVGGTLSADERQRWHKTAQP
jgi:hypothetical protein